MGPPPARRSWRSCSASSARPSQPSSPSPSHATSLRNRSSPSAGPLARSPAPSTWCRTSWRSSGSCKGPRGAVPTAGRPGGRGALPGVRPDRPGHTAASPQVRPRLRCAAYAPSGQRAAQGCLKIAAQDGL
ncbi:hypothetical protein AMK27_38375 [Streptomyces sp. CB02009]|nr:hypothetical protein AMK27_38375 [Streptomyces sp. CB02009]